MREKDGIPTERRKLAALAREYRRKGYEVAMEVPFAGGKFRADLVAKKDGVTIVTEVKTSESLHLQKDAVAQLAADVAKIPGARLDLVLTNPRRRSAAKTS